MIKKLIYPDFLLIVFSIPMAAFVTIMDFPAITLKKV